MNLKLNEQDKEFFSMSAGPIAHGRTRMLNAFEEFALIGVAD
jgi:hypothetical protein